MRPTPRSLALPLLIGLAMASTAIAQNTFPLTGNVGVGTNNPQTSLHIKAPQCAAQLRLEIQTNLWTNGCGPASSTWDISSSGGNTLAFSTPSISNPVLTLTGTGNVGINTGNPTVELDIAGKVKIADGTQGANRVLTSDATGLASWQALPAAGIGGAGAPTSLAKFTGATTIGGSLITDDGANVFVSSLSGGPVTRMVVADQGGRLSTQAIPPPPTGDNLGNHKATVNLNLQAREIINIAGLRFDTHPSIVQTAVSPWQYFNLPQGFIANYRFLMGQGNIDPAYKLKVEGDAYATGMWIASDENIKTNVTELRDPVNAIMKMRGVEYDVTPDPTSPPYRTVGLIAQEVKEIFPEAVRQNADGQLSLNYNAVVALLIEAVKQQQDTIRAQQRRIERLERRISRVESVPQ